ncbi:hypothetical protein HMPREF0765_0911 [Sphingobacterium spiritivorum ATCC 33300]|uniref:Uncharacterized protein n=1 Tax=Sphingobacterium spiritivorum ATCC 33300 TaxID=525372 RepID=C2FUA5_SPHSI|nr:hypothetical protein HMPREF0765_0911 [Sphingobacterium spiritivorum ATCC 33300]
MNTTHERKTNQNYPQAPLQPITRETPTENDSHMVISSETTTSSNTTAINKLKKMQKAIMRQKLQLSG